MTFTEGLLAMVAAEMKRRGRSQRAMAASLGVDHSTISLWLRGRRGLDGESVDRIVEYYGGQEIIKSLFRDRDSLAPRQYRTGRNVA